MTRIFYLLLLTICFCGAEEPAERIALFNGQDLTGWEGDSQWWTVVDGAITAESTAVKPCKTTNYIVWKGGMPSDFILECDFKISGTGSNSGIHVRSERRPNHDMFGYQADITGDGKLIGFIYHHKRGLVAERGERVKISEDGKRRAEPVGDAAELLKHYKANEWNHYRIVCNGDAITLFLNGIQMCDIIDQDPETKKANGYIGLQMHRGKPMKVQFKNIYLTQTNDRNSLGAPTPKEL